MRITKFLLVAAVALSLAACEQAAERLAEEVAEQAVGGDAEIDVDDEGGSVTLETDEGNISINSGDGTELPDGFPTGIPLPGSYSVTTSTSMSGDDGTSFLVTLEADGLDAASYIADDVVPGLESSGYTVTGESTTTSGDVTFSNAQAEDGTYTVNVGAQQPADGPTLVSIQIFPVS